MFIASLELYKKLSKNRSKSIAAYIKDLIKDNTKILDFGAGNLYLAGALLDFLPKVEIFGIDVIEDQNLDKQVMNHSRFQFSTYNGKNIPAEDNQFDYVIASAVMHHTPSPEYFLVEIKRVLKPGGAFILVEEMYHNMADKIYISAEDLILNKLKKGVPVPLNFRSYDHYKKEFEKLHYEIEFEGFVRPSFPFKHHYVFKLVKMK